MRYFNYLVSSAFLIFFLCFGVSLLAQSKVDYILVSWKENIETDLAGYNLYYGQDSTNLHIKIDCGINDECLLEKSIDVNTKYYFAVTAYDTSGNESGKSKIIPYIYIDKADTTSPLIPIIEEIINLRRRR